MPDVTNLYTTALELVGSLHTAGVNNRDRACRLAWREVQLWCEQSPDHRDALFRAAVAFDEWWQQLHPKG